MELRLTDLHTGILSSIICVYSLKSEIKINYSGIVLSYLLVKHLPAMQETPVRFLAQEDLLEKG